MKSEFMQHVTVADSGCWTWDAALPGTYGHFGGRLAHHVAYELFVEPIPIHTGAWRDGPRICHRCDNPSCVNPEHLFLGDHAANMADMSAKGRGRNRVLDEDLVREIRQRGDLGEDARKMAQEYGVSPTTIYNIVSRTSWSQVS